MYTFPKSELVASTKIVGLHNNTTQRKGVPLAQNICTHNLIKDMSQQ